MDRLGPAFKAQYKTLLPQSPGLFSHLMEHPPLSALPKRQNPRNAGVLRLNPERFRT